MDWLWLRFLRRGYSRASRWRWPIRLVSVGGESLLLRGWFACISTVLSHCLLINRLLHVSILLYEDPNILANLPTLVMLWIPITQANIAKLVTASASHMVTALVSLDKDFTLGAAFPIWKLLLKVYIAWTFMLSKHALKTKWNVAFRAFVGNV